MIPLMDRLKVKFRNLSEHKEIPERRLLAPGLEIIKSAVCANYAIDRDKLLSSKRGITNEPRNVAIYLARRRCVGYREIELHWFMRLTQE